MKVCAEYGLAVTANLKTKKPENQTGFEKTENSMLFTLLRYGWFFGFLVFWFLGLCLKMVQGKPKKAPPLNNVWPSGSTVVFEGWLNRRCGLLRVAA